MTRRRHGWSGTALAARAASGPERAVVGLLCGGMEERASAPVGGVSPWWWRRDLGVPGRRRWPGSASSSSLWWSVRRGGGDSSLMRRRRHRLCSCLSWVDGVAALFPCCLPAWMVAAGAGGCLGLVAPRGARSGRGGLGSIWPAGSCWWRGGWWPGEVCGLDLRVALLRCRIWARWVRIYRRRCRYSQHPRRVRPFPCADAPWWGARPRCCSAYDGALIQVSGQSGLG